MADPAIKKHLYFSSQKNDYLINMFFNFVINFFGVSCL